MTSGILLGVRCNVGRNSGLLLLRSINSSRRYHYHQNHCAVWLFRSFSSTPPNNTNNKEEPHHQVRNASTEASAIKSSSTKPYHQYIGAISDLSKAKLSALVVTTSCAGFLAAGGPISWPTLAALSAGTALCSSSASAFNQVLERDRDARMKRTKNRPLVRGDCLTPQTATAIATMCGIGGGSILLWGTDPTTASLGVANILLYAGPYTYLKPRHEINTWVGAVVGAIPPVMGWTASGGSIFDAEALLLGSTLFLWQFPHFFALSWMHRVDYGRGGFQMVPVNDSETRGDRTSALIQRYTCYLSTVPIVSSVLGVTSSMFAVEGVALNAYALYVARKFDQDRTNTNAKKVFFTSLWYLPVFMTLFIIHSRRWKDEQKDEITTDQDFIAFLRRRVSAVRNIGRELCVHEFVVSKEDENNSSTPSSSGAEKCPISLGKTKALKVTETGVKVASTTAPTSIRTEE